MGNNDESSKSPAHTGDPTTSAPTNPPDKSILCPRCGYDLRGITQTWDETGACPLTGKCSECGLDFDWHSIYADFEHPWLFESIFPKYRVLRFFRTIIKTHRPLRWLKNGEQDPFLLRNLRNILLFRSAPANPELTVRGPPLYNTIDS